MDERWSPDPAGADRIENMHFGAAGAWCTAGGFAPAFTAEAQLGPIFSIHWFAQHQGGRQWVVFERKTGTTLDARYVDFAADSSVSIQGGRTLVNGPWGGTTYFEIGNWLYLINGYDRAVRWNGDELVDVGFSSAPPPPTLSPSGYDQADADYSGAQAIYDSANFQRGVGQRATGSEPVRWAYGYAITWVNDLGQESPPSPIVFLEDENPGEPSGGGPPPTPPIKGRRSVLLHSPAAPANVRGTRVYRTADVSGVSTVGQQGFALYFHSEYAAAEVSINDDTPDAELGAEFDPDSVGIWPQSARYAQTFKGTLFVDGGTEAPSRVRFSAAGLPEQMPEINHLTVGDATTGPIMGLKSTHNALVVFKRRGIYLVKGRNPSFLVETLTEDVGCAAPRSIVEVPGVGTMFISDDGPYILEGALENTGTPTRLAYLGAPIAKTWRTRVNTKALLSCRATRHMRDREVWLQVPADGQDRPSLGLVYHYTASGWSLRVGYPFSCLTEDRGHQGLLYAGSWDTDSHEGVHVYTRGHDLNGGALSSSYESAWIDLGKRTLVRNVEVDYLNVGRALTFEWHVDRDVLVWTAGPDGTLRSKDVERNRDAWGLGVWDTASWQPLVPVLARYDTHQANGFEFQFRVTSTDLSVLGHAVVVKPDAADQRKRNDR